MRRGQVGVRDGIAGEQGSDLGVRADGDQSVEQGAHYECIGEIDTCDRGASQQVTHQRFHSRLVHCH